MTRIVPGYLPNDRPQTGRLILLGLQHVLTMFPATVFVALLCGFHASTVLLGAGVSTTVALLLSRRAIGTYIPLFYGSSFSYIAAYLGIAQAMGHKVQFGVPAPDEVISVLQTGIIATGLLNIIVGFVIRAVGKNALDRVLPPVVTGSVACVIGIGLAKAALDMSFMGRLLGHRAFHARCHGGVFLSAAGQGLHRHAADPARRDRRLSLHVRHRAGSDQLQERGRDAVLASRRTSPGPHSPARWSRRRSSA